jgi:alcohol dehydrogenase class IV
VHGFAGPLGGMFPAPHGALCAALLPHVMEINLRALQQRQPSSPALRRYDEVGRLLTGNAQANAEAGVQWARQVVHDLRIPPLNHYGIQREHFAELIDKAGTASSMKANSIALTPQELTAILEASC